MMVLFVSAFVGCLVFAAGLWFFCEKIRNASVIDAVWSLLIAVPAVFYLFSAGPLTSRRGLMAMMVAAWALRLSVHIGTRLIHEKKEDARYTRLREAWGSEHARKMLRFFLIQAAAAVFFSLPFLVVAGNSVSALGLFEFAGLGIWTIAFLGEAAADHQLSGFKRDPVNRGKTCRVGLWNYSRHPNYFFEWLIWVSFSVFALGSPYGWMTVIFPAAMFYFLKNKTGVPLSEKQALVSRGESYLAYQKEVNAFFPWFPKRGPGR